MYATLTYWRAAEATVNDRFQHRQAIIEALRGRLKPETSLLDFGCGAGLDLRAWRALGIATMVEPTASTQATRVAQACTIREFVALLP